MKRAASGSPGAGEKVWRQVLDFICPSGMEETPARFILRVAAGLVFLATGMMKLVSSIVLGSSVPHVPPGIPGFGEYLAAVGVPLPLFSACAVTVVEVGGALVLLASAFWAPATRLTRMVSAVLAVDMLVAIVTVGLRNLAGHPVILQGVPVTFQAWRLPLEVGLLLTMLFFLRFPAPTRGSGQAREREAIRFPNAARGDEQPSV